MDETFSTDQEIPTEELARVAASLMIAGISSGEALAKAHDLLTEARKFKGTRAIVRGHGEGGVAEIVTDVLNETTTLIRKKLLVSLLKAFNHPTKNEDDGEKLFNRWLQHELRNDDFQRYGPFGDSITEASIDVHFSWNFLPSKTRPDGLSSPRPLQDGEHVTAPWWGTLDAWWPNPTKGMIKEWVQITFGKDPPERDVLSKPMTFRSKQTARRVLLNFARWIRERESETAGHSVPRKPRRVMRSKATGRFLPRKGKG